MVNWMDGWMDQTGRCMAESIDLVGYVGGCISGWEVKMMNGWIDGQINCCIVAGSEI